MEKILTLKVLGFFIHGSSKLTKNKKQTEPGNKWTLLSYVSIYIYKSSHHFYVRKLWLFVITSFFFLPFPYNPPCCRQMQWSYIPSFINLVLLLLFFLIIATNNKTKHFTYYAAFYASQNPSEILPPLNLPNILCDWQGKCCLSVWVRKLNWIAFQCRAQHPLPNPV